VVAKSLKRRIHTLIMQPYLQSESGSSLSDLSDSAFERLLVIHLDEKDELIEADFQTSVESDSITFPLRKIISDALMLETHSLIIAHNHPSGVAQPSKDDVRQTRLLEKTLAPLRIGIMDHLIFAGNNRFSFRAAGLL
jgi:DNA repair protein RadC